MLALLISTYFYYLVHYRAGLTHLSHTSFQLFTPIKTRDNMRFFTALSVFAIFAPAAMALQPGDVPVEIAVRSDA